MSPILHPQILVALRVVHSLLYRNCHFGTLRTLSDKFIQLKHGH